ncbi:MAG TPA: glycosyltransferase family 4 protein [Nitrospiraceae bacterium]|jgi:glycosyltransferase involved in cell wall biosynthesis|nr:glycosyltransferase family 4 protein [Nitrospiraceae bacterium]
MKKTWTIAWCHNGDAGGSKRFAFEMVRELSKRGHVIDEVILRGPVNNTDYLPLKPFVRTSTEVVLHSPDLSRQRPYLLYSSALLAFSVWKVRHQPRDIQILAGRINTSDYDFVHIDHYPHCRATSILPYLELPSVLYSHEPSPVRYLSVNGQMALPGPSGLKGGYARLCEGLHHLANYVQDRHDIRLTNCAQAVLINSQFSKEVFFQRYGRLSTVCRYGVDYHTFRPLPVSVEPLVVSIGRLVTVKQHHIAIEAVGMIDQTRRPRMVIATPESVDHVKDRHYSTAIEKLAKDKGVALDVWYRPSQHDLAKLYNQAIALIFVPIMEPFGLVAIEAMACGTPVVGVNEAGIRESVVEGVNGMLVDRDPGEIAKAIGRLMDSQNLRAAMGKQAVEYVRQRWTWQQAADHYEEEIRKLLEGVRGL